MTLRIVGAGLGRTGTLSLKTALETLTGTPCYHMYEVITHPEHVAYWQTAVDGGDPGWDTVFDGYDTAVDWPVCAFWRELAAKYPDAKVLLSTRSSADAWWKSANATIFQISQMEAPPDEFLAAHRAMVHAMWDKTFTPDWRDEDAAKRAYEAHNATVRAEVPPERLVEWQPGDGWKPICDALGVPVPDAEFPHTNTSEEFRSNFGLE